MVVKIVFVLAAAWLTSGGAVIERSFIDSVPKSPSFTSFADCFAALKALPTAGQSAGHKLDEFIANSPNRAATLVRETLAITCSRMPLDAQSMLPLAQ